MLFASEARDVLRDHDNTPRTCFTEIDEYIQRMTPEERANAAQFLDPVSLLTLKGLGVKNIRLANTNQFRLSGPIRHCQTPSGSRLKPYPVRTSEEATLRSSLVSSIETKEETKSQSGKKKIRTKYTLHHESKVQGDVQTLLSPSAVHKEDNHRRIVKPEESEIFPSIQDPATLVTSSHNSPPKEEIAQQLQRFRKVLAAFPHKKISLLSAARSLKFTIGNTPLLDILKEVVPDRRWHKDLILYLPGQTITTMSGAHHHLAFGPMTQAIPNSEHRVVSEFESLYGERREIFTSRKKGIGYIGTFRCHSLKDLAPTGCPYFAQLSMDSILCAAVPPILPKGFPSLAELRSMYESGALRLECMALELVGIDRDLFEGLSRYHKARMPPRPKRKGIGRK